MKLDRIETTVRLSILNIILLLVLFGSVWLLEGCTIDVEPAPITVEEITVKVEVTATLNCNEYSLAEYLTAEVCDHYDFDECCNLLWNDVGCYISFCDKGCIGLTEECYGEKQNE